MQVERLLALAAHKVLGLDDTWRRELAQIAFGRIDETRRPVFVQLALG